VAVVVRLDYGTSLLSVAARPGAMTPDCPGNLPWRLIIIFLANPGRP
jgi:hypothetical protein